MRRTYFRTRPLPVRHVTDVTSGEKAPLGRILEVAHAQKILPDRAPVT